MLNIRDSSFQTLKVEKVLNGLIAARANLLGCYLILVCFLMIASGIDGTPYIKQVGVIGLSVLIPVLLVHYLFALEKDNGRSRVLALVSLASVLLTMTLALVNEFSSASPRVAFEIPVMVLVHGLANALLTVPCFYLSIRLEAEKKVIV